MPVSLYNSASVLCVEDGGEVKHGDVWLAVVVVSKVEGGELVLGGHVSGLLGVGEQCFLVHVVPGQQPCGVLIVLGKQWRCRIRGIAHN